MTAPIPTVCDAIVTAINEDEDIAVHAERRYLYDSSKEGLPVDAFGMNVYVVPATREADPSSHSRGAVGEVFTVKLFFVGRPVGNARPSDDRMDDFVSKVDEVALFLRRKRFGGAVWIGDEIDPVFDVEHFHTKHQFVSVLTLTLAHRR